ncbi:MAG: cysteine desulfurase family protein [Actinomycetota bacterium]|nr:cysteine desulfurase [Acidimicrobiales bacterium]MEC8814735.1 cysteine desulfurase family protein [Actinomycetota bacterium]MEC8983383.1 cysteine desulfurase family protein [Actinomycetota bacterium]MEC9056978.1 cysteine desulfurase family protein [Actinomycetota bacterium]MEC9426330.1 cysteine desulfurase family protein [Actinomycetota bacterium]
MEDLGPQAYLDHAASTPTRSEVVAAMVPWLADHPGNPSGSHAVARAARRAVDDARDRVAALVGATAGEVVFTSGGTEADNLAVDGVVRATGGLPVCSAVEHPAVLAPVREAGGVVVPTDAGGRIDLDALAVTLAGVDGIRLVSVMAANNETGVINDLDAVANVVAEHAPEAVLHTDAVQAAAWVDLGPVCRSAALVSLTGHKFGGPKGAGALVVRDGVPMAAVLRGGGQERDRRAGTQNVPAIVGLGEAARLVQVDREATVRRIGALRDRLEGGLVATVDGVHRTVPDGTPRTPGVAHLCISGVESEALLFLLERHGLSASAGSSCASGAQEPSHVLAAMGVDRTAALGSVRLSLGHTSTAADVDHALAVIPATVAQLRQHAYTVGYG